MQLKNKQKGLTGVSIMALLAILAFVVVTLLKIMPIYFDAYKVDDVLSSLQSERGLGELSNRELIKIIRKRLDVNMVDDVQAEHIFIEKSNNDIFIDVEYEVRQPLFGNLDVIIYFKKSVEVPAI